MASWSISDDKQKELLELAQAWGKVVARRACESQPLKADTHITPMEDVAFQVGQALTQGVLQALLEQHAQQLPAEISCPTCQAPCPVNREPRVLHLRGGGVIEYDEPVGECSACRRAFSPSRLALGLDNHSYTPTVLANIIFAGGDAKSFGKGEAYLRRLAELDITGRHVGRLTQKIGAELARKRDEEVALYRRRELPAAVEVTPAAVVVAVDGGRVQTRTPAQGFGVHDPHWREDKVACLCTLQSPECATDPHPQVPRCYLDRDYVRTLVDEMHTQRGGVKNQGKPAEKACPASSVDETAPPGKTPRWQPERLVRTVVATLEDSAAFGPMVAAEAQRRNFFASPRAAFVGDGQAYNWTIHRTWFPDFTDIVDFVHGTSYVYQAARASVGPGEDSWPTYVRWITAVWQGQVANVLADLRVLVGPSSAIQDPARIESLQESLTYLQNNESRMDYPRYRRLGLPIVSALVESLVKEINWRVKGTEKFWNDPAGAEAILQVRAALLSEDDRLTSYLANRAGRPYRRQRARAA